MSVIGALQPFNPSSDDFEDWVEVFHQFLAGNKLDATTAADQCRGIFCSNLGLSTFTLLKDLISPTKPTTEKLDDLIAALKTHFKPTPKVISERYKFGKRCQMQGESVNSYLAELRKLAITCKFKCCLDERIRDQFILGLASAPAQKVLFAKDDSIKLSEVVAIAIAQEAAQASTTLVRDTNESSRENPVHKTGRGSKTEGKSNYQSQSRSDKGSKSGKTCPNCGSSKHFKSKECPHKNVECHSCHKKGHFAKLCRSSTSRSEAEAESSHKVSVSRVHAVKPASPEVIINLCINGAPHQMEFDTGCRQSILSETFWRSLGSPTLHPSTLVFESYTHQKFRPLGTLKSQVQYKDQVISYDFPVYKGSSLFGRDLMKLIKIDWSEVRCQLNHVSTNDSLESVLNEFADVFAPPEGQIRGFKGKIILRDDATPRFYKARPVPFALKPKVDAELDKMVRQGVITKVETSDWASPLVVAPRPNGRIRITGDFKNTVNSQLHVTQYPLARADDLFANVSGGEKFSKLDGPDAFHQIEVEESSRKFLVINTHRGLYRYNVLPMGISSSPAIFQEFMDQLSREVRMAGGFLDDLLLSGKSDAEHLASLRVILSRMRKYNYKLSRDKCEFMKNSVQFIGYILSKDGIRTSPSKVECMVAIQRPNNVSELSSFLGLVNFYRSFVPRFADLCEPLYRLTQNEVKWQWSKECDKAFEEVKRTLSSTEVLAHFDQSLPIGLSCDASPIGLGVVLFHQYPDGSERPIAYASKILSPAERRYSQIDREALGIVFGVKKFFQFLCGTRFLLVTDHEPLLHIFGPTKQLPAYAATRVHGWSVFLSQFQFDVVYRNTKKHGNADALSRLPVGEEKDFSSDISCHVNVLGLSTLENLPVTSKKIRLLTSRDKTLSTVFRYVRNGWPEQVKKDDVLYPYFIRRNELSIMQGVILWGLRVLVPTGLRQQLLTNLHTGHFGIVRMKSLAREFVWWPNIDSDIKALALNCTQCRESSHSPPSALLHPWEFPEKPWQRLHVDLAGPFLGKMWLVIVDAHSKWPEVYCLNNNSTATPIIYRIRDCIIRFGIPDQIVSDNGTQFTSEEFQDFCKSNGIRHSTSSVYHPRSNGEAERFIQTFKKAMVEVSKSSGVTRGNWELVLQQFLFTYRLTPHATTGTAPCELLQGRKLKCLLDLVRPDVSVSTADSQSRQKQSFDKKTRSRNFEIGQRVWVKTFSKNEPKWSLGTIIKRKGPVTFVVCVSSINYRRHQDQILDAGPTFPFTRAETEDVEDDEAPVVPPSPVKKPATPRRGEPVPVNFGEEDEIERIELESDDEGQVEEPAPANPPQSPVEEPERERTPYQDRQKRNRTRVQHYQAGFP